AATITVAAPGGNGNEVFFLLNPGLMVTEVTCEGKALRFNRYRERLRIILPADTTGCTLDIVYAGWPVAANDSTMILGDGQVFLDKLQFWYPVDLKSFSALSVSM